MSAKKNTITMTRAQAVWFADLGLSAISKDNLTPVLDAAHVEVDGSTARVTSTDRYRAHTGTVKLQGKAKAHSFVLSREALMWLKKNHGYHGRSLMDFQRITIATVIPDNEVDTPKVTITVKANETPDAASLSWSGDLVKGNFPPVWKLIAEGREAEGGAPHARVNLGFLAEAGVLGHRHYSPKIKFTKQKEDSKRPGVAYLEFREYDGSPEVIAEAIIQPNAEVQA